MPFSGYNGPIEEPVQPLQYVRPPLYANNACRNNLGELVPCAFPSSAGASVYAYNNYPQINFFDFTGGLAAPVAPAGQFGCGILYVMAPKMQDFCPRINMLKGFFLNNPTMNYGLSKSVEIDIFYVKN